MGKMEGGVTPPSHQSEQSERRVCVVHVPVVVRHRLFEGMANRVSNLLMLGLLPQQSAQGALGLESSRLLVAAEYAEG